MVIRRSFSTVNLPEENRLQLWEDYSASHLFGLRSSTANSSGPLSTNTSVDLGSVRVAEISSSPQIVERSENYIRSHPTESLAAILLTKGTGFFYHEGGFTAMSPGDLMVINLDQRFINGFSSTSTQYIVRIPRPVGLRLDVLNAGEGLTVRREDALGLSARTALVQQIRKVLAPGADDDAPSPAESLLHDPLLELLSDYGRGEANHADSALQVAMWFIRENIMDPGLNANGVAQKVGMSRRNLSRIFAKADLSVANFILQERLALARRFLADPRDIRPLADIAQQCGFVSLSHFSRSFKARYGSTPSDFRRIV